MLIGRLTDVVVLYATPLLLLCAQELVGAGSSFRSLLSSRFGLNVALPFVSAWWMFLPLDYYTFSFRIVLKSQRRWYKHLSDENHCDSSIARDYVCSFFSESYAAEANDAAGVDVAKDCALP